jgi:hypothetical protein
MPTISPETRAAILAELREGLVGRDIAARHQVSRNAVSKIGLKAGLRRKQRASILDADEIAEVLARYAARERTPAIAASFGISVDLVMATLHRAGIAPRDMVECHTRLSLRHDALDTLTPDAAYWLGFIFTDGTVQRRKRDSPTIAIVLKKSDREHLVKFRDFLGSEHAITPIKPAPVIINPGMGTGAVRFAVHSRQLADRIEALGRYGPAVDPELAASRDFWRGAIDGDGTIGISCGIPQCKLVGSKWLLGAFVDFLGPIGRRPLNVRPARSIYVVSTSGTTTEKLLDRLYTGAGTVLDRKAAAAAEILDARPKPQADTLWADEAV